MVNVLIVDIISTNAAGEKLAQTGPKSILIRRDIRILNNSIDSIKHICFDLDGTIVDSNQTIYKATEITLKQLGIDFNVSEDDFAYHIGKHFVDIFKHFNINVTDFETFITLYKQKYFDLMEYSHIYSEVDDTLKKLHSNGLKISLLTTKVQEQADRIIDHFKLREYFDFVMGRRDGIPHKPSPVPLKLITEELNLPIENTLMVGDTELDIQCGKSAGAKTCGVLYGYRTEEQIKKESPDFIINSPSELISVLFD